MSPVTMSLTVLCCLTGLLLMSGAGIGAGERTIEDYICRQQFRGCKIDYASRGCTEGFAVGCTNPFPYHSMDECEKDFHGKGNICDAIHPCRHGGACLPVTTNRKGRTFKCDCSATGYYGTRCQKKCPHHLSWKRPRQTACVKVG